MKTPTTPDRPRDARNGVEARIMLGILGTVSANVWNEWRSAPIFPRLYGGKGK